MGSRNFAATHSVSVRFSLARSSGLPENGPLKHGGNQAQYEGGLNGAAATAVALFVEQFQSIGGGSGAACWLTVGGRDAGG